MTEGGTSEPDGGSSSSKPSKAWLVALPVAALIAAGALWAVTSSEPAKSTPPGQAAPGAAAAAPADSSLEGIAVQRADLPEPSVKCSFSGDVETYMKALKDAKSESYDSVVQTWKQLQEKGATAAYIAWWGDAQPACDDVVSSSNSMDHGAGSKHPTTTFSFVVRYNSPDSAASAYRAEIFGQSSEGDAQLRGDDGRGDRPWGELHGSGDAEGHHPAPPGDLAERNGHRVLRQREPPTGQVDTGNRIREPSHHLMNVSSSLGRVAGTSTESTRPPS